MLQSLRDLVWMRLVACTVASKPGCNIDRCGHAESMLNSSALEVCVTMFIIMNREGF